MSALASLATAETGESRQLEMLTILSMSSYWLAKSTTVPSSQAHLY